MKYSFLGQCDPKQHIYTMDSATLFDRYASLIRKGKADNRLPQDHKAWSGELADLQTLPDLRTVIFLVLNGTDFNPGLPFTATNTGGRERKNYKDMQPLLSDADVAKVTADAVTKHPSPLLLVVPRSTSTASIGHFDLHPSKPHGNFISAAAAVTASDGRELTSNQVYWFNEIKSPEATARPTSVAAKVRFA